MNELRKALCEILDNKVFWPTPDKGQLVAQLEVRGALTRLVEKINKQEKK